MGFCSKYEEKTKCLQVRICSEFTSTLNVDVVFVIKTPRIVSFTAQPKRGQRLGHAHEFRSAMFMWQNITSSSQTPAYWCTLQCVGLSCNLSRALEQTLEQAKKANNPASTDGASQKWGLSVEDREAPPIHFARPQMYTMDSSRERPYYVKQTQKYWNLPSF